MLRVIFDTNIYGHLINEEHIREIKRKIFLDTNFIIYGFKPIRKELRNTPKVSKLGKYKLRNLLLNLYDELTKNKYLEDHYEISVLAWKIYKKYRINGGIKNWNKTNIDVDFSIVACAIINKLDIVVSADSKTILSRASIKSFKEISKEEELRLPKFWTYSNLKKKYNFN